MKKSKLWIRVCVHLLLFITLGVHSSEFVVNPVTDDISRLWPLRQNIPKDYKIPVHYVPKEEAGMCWVKLNVFYLEESLKDLAHKFGNISSNRKDISIFIQMLQELRLKMESVEPIMYDFECHYRKERWPTARYFDFVEDFLIAAPPQYRQDSDECDPPPCPTTTTYTSSTTTTTTKTTTTTTQYLPDSSAESPLPSGTAADCDSASTDCKSWNEQQRFLPEAVERSLLLLLVIPVAAVVFLLVWKVRSKRNREDPEQNSGEGGLFAGSEVTAPSLTVEITEKRPLLSSGLCPKFPTEIELNTKMYFVVIPETPLRILSSDCSPKLALPLYRDSSG